MKKHIVCLGDSNTHGYNANPADSETDGFRFSENERWTHLLQKKLGDDYLVIEEGLSGRTTVFVDPIHESMDAISVIYPILKSHETVDLLVIMLGTNDTKERFCANAAAIGKGMERLVLKAKSVDCWGEKSPNILIVAPPPIEEPFLDPVMGDGCPEKSRGIAEYYKQASQLLCCHFFDANGCEFNSIDRMHLTKLGHAQLAEKLSRLIPGIM